MIFPERTKSRKLQQLAFPLVTAGMLLSPMLNNENIVRGQSPTDTPTIEPSPIETPTPTIETPTPVITATPVVSPTIAPTETATPVVTPTIAPTETATPVVTPTLTLIPRITPTLIPSPTETPTLGDPTPTPTDVFHIINVHTYNDNNPNGLVDELDSKAVGIPIEVWYKKNGISYERSGLTFFSDEFGEVAINSPIPPDQIALFYKAGPNDRCRGDFTQHKIGTDCFLEISTHPNGRDISLIFDGWRSMLGINTTTIDTENRIIRIKGFSADQYGANLDPRIGILPLNAVIESIRVETGSEITCEISRDRNSAICGLPNIGNLEMLSKGLPPNYVRPDTALKLEIKVNAFDPNSDSSLIVIPHNSNKTSLPAVTAYHHMPVDVPSKQVYLPMVSGQGDMAGLEEYELPITYENTGYRTDATITFTSAIVSTGPNGLPNRTDAVEDQRVTLINGLGAVFPNPIRVIIEQPSEIALRGDFLKCSFDGLVVACSTHKSNESIGLCPTDFVSKQSGIIIAQPNGSEEKKYDIMRYFCNQDE